MYRRRFLVATCATGSLGLAGCLGSDDDNTDNGDGNGDGGQPPTAAFEWTPANPSAGEPVTFDASGSQGMDSELVRYRWTFGGTVVEEESHTATYTFNQTGDVEVTLEIEDDAGETDSQTKTLSVGDPKAFSAAVSTLVDVATRLTELRNVAVEITDMDLTELRDDLDAATASLDETESAVEGDLDGRLTAARDVRALQESLLTSRENSREFNLTRRIDPAFASLESAMNGVESPSDIDTSVVGEIQQSLEQDVSVEEQLALYDTLETTMAELNATPLDEESLAYDGDLSQYVRYDRNLVELNGATMGIYRDYFGAFGPFFDGLIQFEDEQWSEARNLFEEAETAIESAITRVEEMDTTNIPEDAVVGPEEIIANFTTVKARLAEFTAIATTAVDGDVETAQQEFDTLFEELTGTPAS